MQMKKYLESIGVKFNNNILGITLKKFLSHSKQKRYEESFKTFIDENSHDNTILLIPQITATEQHDDDRIVSEKVYNKLFSKKNVFLIKDEMNAFSLKGIYENLNYLIGTRMHSCIFSLTALVPTLAIEYEYKTSGMMRDLGLSEWVIKMEDVEPEILNNRFQKLKLEYSLYVDKLKQIMPKYSADYDKPAKIILEDLTRS